MVNLLMQSDQNILLFIQEYIRQDWMSWFWKGITHLGDAGMIWILLAVILLIPKKTRKAGIAAAVALLLSLLITNLCLKNTVARIRPYEMIDGLKLMIEKQKDFSFPSGHASASFAAACAFYHTLPKKWGIAAIVLAALISLSRLYVGVHYPSDVLCGMLIGIFAGWVGWKLEEAVYKKRYGKV